MSATKGQDRAILYAWLDGVIDKLPPTGQIILNFDGNTVKWELKVIQVSHDRNGDIERTEVRRSGQLPIYNRVKRPVSIS